MSPPPTNIDGTDITGATIDGQDVQEITIDGETVFTAGPPLILSDDFDDGTITGFTQLVGSWSESGTHLFSGSGEFKIRWDDAGLRGNESFRVRTFPTPDIDEPNSNANPSTFLFFQDGNNFYQVIFGASFATGQSDLGILQAVNGNFSALVTSNNNVDVSQQYRVTADYDSANQTITAELFRVADSTVIATVSTGVNPQSDFGTSTGDILLGSFAGDAEDCRWDAIELFDLS